MTKVILPKTSSTSHAIRGFWPYFIKNITNELWLQEHFLKHMRMFDEVFDQAERIDKEMIHTFLETIYRPFPIGVQKAVYYECHTLLQHYVSKITVDNFGPTTDNFGPLPVQPSQENRTNECFEGSTNRVKVIVDQCRIKAAGDFRPTSYYRKGKNFATNGMYKAALSLTGGSSYKTPEDSEIAEAILILTSSKEKDAAKGWFEIGKSKKVPPVRTGK